jgi:hypothetical protein
VVPPLSAALAAGAVVRGTKKPALQGREVSRGTTLGGSFTLPAGLPLALASATVALPTDDKSTIRSGTLSGALSGASLLCSSLSARLGCSGASSARHWQSGFHHPRLAGTPWRRLLLPITALLDSIREYYSIFDANESMRSAGRIVTCLISDASGIFRWLSRQTRPAPRRSLALESSPGPRPRRTRRRPGRERRALPRGFARRLLAQK